MHKDYYLNLAQSLIILEGGKDKENRGKKFTKGKRCEILGL